MARTADFLPPAEEALLLPVEDFALRLLAFLATAQDEGNRSLVNANNIMLESSWAQHDLGPKPGAFMLIVAEAWAWLEGKAFLSRTPDQSGDWMRVTRLGRQVLERGGVQQLRAEERLGVDLHPRLERRVRPSSFWASTTSLPSRRCER